MRPTARILVLICLSGSILGSSSAHAAVFTVDRFDDVTPIPGACTAAPNDCSLRGAIKAANIGPGNDTILVPPGLYLLTLAGNSEELNLSGDLDVFGIGEDLVIDGDDTDPPTIQQTTDDRIFDLSIAAGSVTFRDLILTGGDSPDVGGAIRSNGNGALAIERLTFRSNHAATFGGCLVRLDSSVGNAVVSDSRFENCTAGGDGGAIRFRLSPSPFQDAISRCQFVGNTAPQGGALTLDTGNFLKIEDTVFLRNQALDPTFSSGGSISMRGGSVLLNRVSIVDSKAGPASSPNAYGGAIDMLRLGTDRPSLSMVNVTISRSVAESVFSRGSAIHLSEGDLDLLHVTITESRTAGQHAIFVQGPVSAPPATVDFDSSVIDGGCASQNLVTLGSGAYNVERPWNGTTVSTCGLTNPSDVITQADLELRPPAVYGGPSGVWSQEPLPGSLLGGLVPATSCAVEDARTAPRAFLFCAAGAHEPTGLAPGPWIFADGFDSSDTGAWSAAVP